jgi:hypothetical protein
MVIVCLGFEFIRSCAEFIVFCRSVFLCSGYFLLFSGGKLVELSRANILLCVEKLVELSRAILLLFSGGKLVELSRAIFLLCVEKFVEFIDSFFLFRDGKFVKLSFVILFLGGGKL